MEENDVTSRIMEGVKEWCDGQHHIIIVPRECFLYHGSIPNFMLRFRGQALATDDKVFPFLCAPACPVFRGVEKSSLQAASRHCSRQLIFPRALPLPFARIPNMQTPLGGRYISHGDDDDML